MLPAYYCLYIYVGQGLQPPVQANKIVLYEPLANHDGDGVFALYGDGHVEWLAKADAERLIPEATHKSN
jgi:hypothetical protein